MQGKGWEENVAHAMAVIKGEYKWERKDLTDKDVERLKKEGIDVPKKDKPWHNPFASDNPSRGGASQRSNS